jgi:hypothetical protein
MTNINNWKEKDLFEWLKQNKYFTLVKAKNPMSRWDCYDIDTKHRLELKCRKKHYDTMLLEKKKYDALIAESEKHLDIPLYVNSTPEGIYLWSLYLIKPKWEINYLNPATTQFGNRNRIPKEVTYLCIKDAIKLL